MQTGTGRCRNSQHTHTNVNISPPSVLLPHLKDPGTGCVFGVVSRVAGGREDTCVVLQSIHHAATLICVNTYSYELRITFLCFVISLLYIFTTLING